MMSALAWIERTTRAAMVTVGFKELIEKLEEYFGKRIVKAFLGAIGIAVFLFLVGIAVRGSFTR